MRPKFEVGEVVLLRSLALPQHNGEYTVRIVIPSHGIKRPDRLHPSGEIRARVATGFAYILEEIALDAVASDGLPCEGSWAETALRKKHIPGELNFRELMTSLSSPKLLTHSPR